MNSIQNSLSDWKKTFTSDNVQPMGSGTGDFLSGESVVLVSGPPKMLSVGTSALTNLIPLGLVQNVQVSQGKQLQQLFEIGSRLPYFVPGRTMIQVGMARVLFDGPSLMSALYTRADGDNLLMPKISNPNDATIPPTAPYAENSAVGDNEFVVGTLKGTSSNAPIVGEFFINLASEFFNRPMGLGFILFDMQQQPYGGFYLENCFIQSHTFSVSSQQTVLMENVGLRAANMKSLDITSL